MANNKQSVNEFLHRIFGRFDGSISKEEFRRTLTLIQKENVKPSEVDEELEKVDFDNDGKIDFKGKIVIKAQNWKSSLKSTILTMMETFPLKNWMNWLKMLMKRHGKVGTRIVTVPLIITVINIAKVRLHYFFPLVFSISEFLMVIFDVEAEFEKRSWTEMPKSDIVNWLPTWNK